MSSMFGLFTLKVFDKLELEVLDFRLFTQLAILEWFSTWNFKHARIPVRTYFQSNHLWFNLVACIGKCMDFVIPIQVIYVAHFFKNSNPFNFYA